MKKLLLFLLVTLVLNVVYAQKNHKNIPQTNYFIENKGQWDKSVLYLTRLGNVDIWITQKGVLYDFYKIEKTDEDISFAKQAIPEKNYCRTGQRVFLELKNSNTVTTHQGRQKQEAYYNYFIGNNPEKHVVHTGLYKEVCVKNVYEGIDIRYYFDRGFLRYDYIVHAGADYRQISFELKGGDNVGTDSKGNLVFETIFGKVSVSELYCYQQTDKKAVPSRFIQKAGGSWGIAVSGYDTRQDLIIDPLLYSTFIGGSGLDESYAIALDNSGNAVITGTTISADFDVTPGTYQTSKNSSNDIFVTKLNASGTALMFSTYLGGSNQDFAYSLALDNGGNVYVTGCTYSMDYSVTAGAYKTTSPGSTIFGYVNIFVTKLNPSGTALLYSTFIGGDFSDFAYAIAVDNSGNAYITGATGSGNYDVTAGAYQSGPGGDYFDAFVTKLNATGSALLYSTYLGGSGLERGNGIAIDAAGNAYITGNTLSSNFPVTTGAFQNTNTNDYNTDIFVTKLNPWGTGLVYSTYLGGSGFDYGNDIVIDNTGNAYITGRTSSTDFDVTSGSFKTIYGGGPEDAFVTKLNATGTALLYSTYLGGNGTDHASSIVIDGLGNACITGYTESANYDVTTGAYQTLNAGFRDAFVTLLNSTGTELLYSTYIGGSDNDIAHAIARDVSGNAYITGITNSASYPVTSGAYQSTVTGEYYNDIFVTKLDFLPTISVSDVNVTNQPAISIYPNPNQGNFEVFSLIQSEVVLYDLMGKQIHRQRIEKGLNHISVHVPAGVYVLQEQSHFTTHKMVVE